MSKLKMVATTTLAVAVIGLGGLAASPPASAMPMSCERALALADAYVVIGNMLYNDGNYAAASYYYGRATGVIEASC